MIEHISYTVRQRGLSAIAAAVFLATTAVAAAILASAPAGPATALPIEPPIVAGATDLVSKAGVRTDRRVPEAIARDGAADVIVALRDPLPAVEWERAPKYGPAADAFDRAAAASAQAVQARVRSALPGGSFHETHRYTLLPAMGGSLDAAGLAALQANPEVVAIGFAEAHFPALAEHVPLVGGDRVHEEYGFTGEGVAVAVFDTGIDTDHPDLEDDLVDQQCYSVAGGCCCNNATQGKNAEDEGGHGTAVSGIITSGGVASPPGIAPDASIAAMRVFNDRGSADTRDIVSGLEWVLRTFRTHNVKVINMSLGSTSTYTGRCDDAASEEARADAITRVVARGIAVFAASGNGGALNAMSAPACLSKIIAVGATYDADVGPKAFGACRDETTAADQITCFTNRNRELSILAPGSSTSLPVVGGGVGHGWSGTSMASPMAAGAAAILFQADPDLSVNELKRLLEETGKPIDDADTTLTKPRIDLYAALESLVGPPPTREPSPTPEASATPEPSPTPEPTAGPSETPTSDPGAPTDPPPSGTPGPIETPDSGSWRVHMPWASRP